METLHTIILIVHVLGATLIIGSVFVSTLVLLAKSIPRDNLLLVERVFKIVPSIIGVQILTGIYLAASEWDAFRHSPLLWLKLALLVIDGVLGGKTIAPIVKRALATKQSSVELPSVARIAILSLLTFLLIAALGVLLAESQA